MEARGCAWRCRSRSTNRSTGCHVPASGGEQQMLVEQNASRALQLARRGYVMASGKVTMSGDAQVLLQDP